MSIQADAIDNEIADTESCLVSKWRTAAFWQRIFLYFFITSVFGHFLEIIIANLVHIFTGIPLWTPIIITVIPMAPPYGIGAIFVILIVVPLIKKYDLSPIGAFVLSCFITGVTEYLSAVTIIMVTGRNAFWDYSSLPFNLNGYIYLEGVLFFGLVATSFVYFAYPWLEKMFNKLKKRRLNTLFWVLFISYVADLSYLFLRGRGL